MWILTNSEASLKKHATCNITALKLNILQKRLLQGWRQWIHHHWKTHAKFVNSKQIQKLRWRSIHMQLMTALKPWNATSQHYSILWFNNPFTTFAEIDFPSVTLVFDDVQISPHNTKQTDEAPKSHNSGSSLIWICRKIYAACNIISNYRLLGF